MHTFALFAAAIVHCAVVDAELKPSAVVFTDVKLDDKLAVRYLSASGNYERVVAVVSAVDNVDGAHGDLRDFLGKMQAGRAGAPVTVLAGDNIRGKPAPHEVNFIGSNIPVDGVFADIINELFLNETKVDVFQIAPTRKEHVLHLVDAKNVHVRMYHLIHGYNSKQLDRDGKDSVVAQLDFLTTIGDEIRHKHKGAVVVFTNNYASFVPAGAGSSQLFSDVKGRLPDDHLEAAINDPFHTKKLNQANDILYRSGVSIPVPLTPDWHSSKDLSALILEARKNEPSSDGKRLRKHFIDFIDHVVPVMQAQENRDQELIDRVRKNVRKSFETELSVELCDANHVAAAVNAVSRKPETIHAMKFGFNSGTGIIEFRDSDYMLKGLTSMGSLELLRSCLLKEEA